MHITVRPADRADIPSLVDLYRSLEDEQTVRKPVWALTDGLDEQFDMQFLRLVEDHDAWLLVGQIDDVVVGMLAARTKSMLERAGGQLIGTVTLIYTDPDARGVGVGHEMLETQLTTFRSLGIQYFDAPVGPGQRAAKNFFEAHGFAARSIVMHHHDD